METREVVILRELFKFSSYVQWTNKGRSWYANSGVRTYRTMALDAKGRVVLSGREFLRAEAEDSYPVTVYQVAE